MSSSSSKSYKFAGLTKGTIFKKKGTDEYIILSRDLDKFHTSYYSNNWRYLVWYKKYTNNGTLKKDKEDKEDKEYSMSTYVLSEDYDIYNKGKEIAKRTLERSQQIEEQTAAKEQQTLEYIINNPRVKHSSNPPKQSVPTSQESLVQGQPKKGGSKSSGAKQMYNGRLRTVYIGSNGGRFVYTDASKKKKVYL